MSISQANKTHHLVLQNIEKLPYEVEKSDIKRGLVLSDKAVPAIDGRATFPACCHAENGTVEEERGTKKLGKVRPASRKTR